MGKNTVENQYNSPNYTPQAQVPSVYGRPRSIDYITIHWWGDPNTQPTYEGVISWFSQTRSQVSAHDIITGTGRRVAVMVDYVNAAWHAGNAVGNATSLGFECDPRCRDEDYAAVAEDVADTWRYYGRVIPLRPHKSWQNTACPGNYDLNRINSLAMALYNGTPEPARASDDEIRQAYLDILERAADDGGIVTYRNTGWSIAQIRADLMNSQERKDLEYRKSAEYAKNEWVRNLAPYVAGDTGYAQSKELLVLPAEGVKRYNLENGTLLNTEVIPKGTSVSVVAKTKVNGVDYLISSYSKSKGQAVGLPASALGVPVVPPPAEKPEWLKNLNDIADKDMWTRSETPVLNIETGVVTRSLAINTKVRITKATHFLGKDLLVVDGDKEVIEVVYLSDTEIKNPNDDIEKRLTVLEAIVKVITDFLSGMFKGFNK